MGMQGLRKVGLKATLPRMKILETLQASQKKHFSAEDVYKMLFEKEEEIVVMVNNLGGTPLMELYIVANSVRKYLKEKLNATAIRFYVGSFMTSLEMQGSMVTCMKIINELQLCSLDMKTSAPAWPKQSQQLTTVTDLMSQSHIHPLIESRDLKNTFDDSEKDEYVDVDITNKIKNACEKIINAEAELTQLDSVVGDGDCGLTMKKGAMAVLDNLNNLSTKFPIDLMGEISYIIGDAMGGSSGALLEIMLNAAASSFKNDYNYSNEKTTAEKDNDLKWVKILKYEHKPNFKFLRKILGPK